MTRFSFPRLKWFQKTAVGIFVAYCLVMLFVIVIAFLRPPGGTGIDAVRMHKIRLDAQEKRDFIVEEKVKEK